MSASFAHGPASSPRTLVAGKGLALRDLVAAHFARLPMLQLLIQGRHATQPFRRTSALPTQCVCVTGSCDSDTQPTHSQFALR